MLERRAKEALDAQVPKARSIAEMAQECGLSSVAFTCAFRNATGRLPHQWAMDRRMDLARARLSHSDDDIATIATACGFSQPGNFSRAFISAAGVSPVAWRLAKRMPGRGRSVVGTAGDSSAGCDDSASVCESKRAQRCVRFEVRISRREQAWTGDITLKLLPREAGAANHSMDAGNVPRNECPRVLLSHDGKQLSEVPNSLVQPTVIVHVDPRFTTDILLAPHQADEDEFTQELVGGLIDCCQTETSCETRKTGYRAMALCARLSPKSR
jgi:AraC-like DNA-binding protein